MMLRAIASVLLGLILSVTSVTAAVAHVRAGGAIQIAICGTPGVEEIITLDVFGDPLPPGHHCPDCAAVGVGEVPEPPHVQRPAGLALAVQAGLHLVERVSRLAPVPAARGPPRGL